MIYSTSSFLSLGRCAIALIGILSLPLCAQNQTPSTALQGELALKPYTIEGPIEKIHNQLTIKTLQQLPERMQAHFGEYISEYEPKAVDFDFIMGLDSGITTIEINFLTGVALSRNVAKERFIQFGYEFRDDTSYSYKLDKSPHLAMPSDLMMTFVGRTVDSIMGAIDERLLARGFRQCDLNRLRDFLNQHNLEKIQFEQRKQNSQTSLDLLPHLKRLIANKANMSPHDYTQHYRALRYAGHYVSEIYSRNWGLQLLAIFDQERQQIMKAFLVSDLNIATTRGISTSPAEKHKQVGISEIEFYEQHVQSGHYEKILTEAVQRKMEAEQ